MDIHPGNDEIRVVNGVVRGRDMHPILIRSVVHAGDQLAGFEQVTPDQMDLLAALTKKQKSIGTSYPVSSDLKKSQTDLCLDRV